MPIQIFTDFTQGSRDWWAHRKKRPTASAFKKILTPHGRLSKQADAYIYALLADAYELEPDPNNDVDDVMTRPMLQGIRTEPVARSWYELEFNVTVHQVGLVISSNDLWGCSPDGLVGETLKPEDLERGLECKCPLLKKHLSYLDADKLPDEHKLQCHGSMVVCELDEWDFMSYYPGQPHFHVRVARTEFTKTVHDALERFSHRLAETEERIIQHGATPRHKRGAKEVSATSNDGGEGATSPEAEGGGDDRAAQGVEGNQPSD